jgi:hypothetical protein
MPALIHSGLLVKISFSVKSYDFLLFVRALAFRSAVSGLKLHEVLKRYSKVLGLYLESAAEEEIKVKKN